MSEASNFSRFIDKISSIFTYGTFVWYVVLCHLIEALVFPHFSLLRFLVLKASSVTFFIASSFVFVERMRERMHYCTLGLLIYVGRVVLFALSTRNHVGKVTVIKNDCHGVVSYTRAFHQMLGRYLFMLFVFCVVGMLFISHGYFRHSVIEIGKNKLNCCLTKITRV